jgi:hypothetical protein
VGFVVDKVALGQVFTPTTSVLPSQFHSTCAPLHGKFKKIVFITGLQNKPQGSGASVASAAGPFFPRKKKLFLRVYKQVQRCQHGSP